MRVYKLNYTQVHSLRINIPVRRTYKYMILKHSPD